MKNYPTSLEVADNLIKGDLTKVKSEGKNVEWYHSMSGTGRIVDYMTSGGKNKKQKTKPLNLL